MLELTDEDEAKVVEDMLDGFLHRAEKRAHDIAQAAKDESRPPLGDVTAYMQENLKILQKLERDLVRMQQRRGARGGGSSGGICRPAGGQETRHGAHAFAETCEQPELCGGCLLQFGLLV